MIFLEALNGLEISAAVKAKQPQSEDLLLLDVYTALMPINQQ